MKFDKNQWNTQCVTGKKCSDYQLPINFSFKDYILMQKSVSFWKPPVSFSNQLIFKVW